MKKLTIYPLSPIELSSGITILKIASTKLMLQVIQSLQCANEGVVLSQDGEMITSKSVNYIGDILHPIDFNKIFGKILIKNLLKQIDDFELNELRELNSTLQSKLNLMLFELDLPGIVPGNWDLSRLLKYLDLQIEEPIYDDLYGIIESIVVVASRLGDTRLIAFCNAALYLSDDQIKALDCEMKINNIEALFFESSTLRESIGESVLNVVEIDDDFVKFEDDLVD